MNNSGKTNSLSYSKCFGFVFFPQNLSCIISDATTRDHLLERVTSVSMLQQVDSAESIKKKEKDCQDLVYIASINGTAAM